jgi:hypothetical protein
VPAGPNRLRLEHLIGQLGSDLFARREQASRELADWGAPALPWLREALRSPDREVVRRAEACIEQIEAGPGAALPLAALRLLVRRRPAGAVEVLLDFVPYADDQEVEAEVLAALGALGVHRGQGEPALVAALRDPLPARRAAAAAVLAHHGDRAQQEAVRPLLADADAGVRFRAAQGLLLSGDRSAVPVLVRLLGEAPLPLAWRAEELLLRVAGDGGPAVSVGAGQAQERRRATAAWEAWWRERGATLDLAGLEGRQGRLTVVVEPEAGSVWECGPDGKPRWQLRGLQGPMDARMLLGGRVLIPEIQGQRVTERDRTGKILWEKRLPGEFPLACQRLPGGHTFIATRQRLLEVHPDGSEVSSQNPPGDFIVIAAERLSDGGLVCLSSAGVVLELDSTGKTRKFFSLGQPAGGWGSVEKLANGHYLVALAALPDGAREVDGGGKTLWHYALPQAGPGYATRLADGSTLIADATPAGHRILIVDRGGKVLWEQPTTGRPLRARRQ